MFSLKLILFCSYLNWSDSFNHSLCSNLWHCRNTNPLFIPIPCYMQYYKTQWFAEKIHYFKLRSLRFLITLAYHPLVESDFQGELILLNWEKQTIIMFCFWASEFQFVSSLFLFLVGFNFTVLTKSVFMIKVCLCNCFSQDHTQEIR